MHNLQLNTTLIKLLDLNTIEVFSEITSTDNIDYSMPIAAYLTRLLRKAKQLKYFPCPGNTNCQTPPGCPMYRTFITEHFLCPQNLSSVYHILR